MSLISLYFTYSKVALNELISKIENSRPVFIRCIKPNENSFSNQFISSIVLKQVKDTSLVEYARVRKLNYQIKMDYFLFVKK
jgi:myosin heavy subunit